ncbi:MAG: hypothetical protein CMK74_03915 [Pseudomonadales bacterium]|nr:hypothetical protein [Pseudomonadales bacterium]|tara:strand:+ start:7477 stop:9441 length:1965 start_codon:yes stop_codon:yes gene_type:complete
MTRHSAKQIQEGWATFLRVLARDSKIKFVIGHNVGPATNGKTVWLPALPAQLTKDDLIMFKSNAFHEIGHIQHSNISWFQEFAKQHGSFAKCLLNALDDVFMERRQARFTKPAERYFRESARIMAERKQFRDGSANAAEAVCCYCLVYLFSRNWPEYRDPLAVIEGNFDKQFGEHAEAVKANLNQILDSEFVNVRSTEDAGKLALRIIAMLKEQSQREEEEEEDQDPNSPEENEEGESEDSSDPDQSGDQDNSGSPEDTESDDSESDKGSSAGNDEDDASDDQAGADNGAGDETTGEPEDGQGAEGESDPAEGEGESGKSLADMVKEMLEAELGDQEVFDKSKAMADLSKEVLSGQSGDYSSTDAVRSIEVDGAVDEGSNPLPGNGPGAGAVKQFVDGMPVCPVNRDHVNELLKAIDRKADVLAGRLRSLLLNREEAETYTTRRGRLGQSHLYRLGLDDSRVFEQQDDIELPTAAVSICADLSGSTEVHCEGSVTCAVSIQQSLLLLEKVLDQLETPREIIGFAPSSGELNTVVRTFGDSHRTALDRIGGLASVTGGYHTPIGEAVFQAASRLEAHESQRKILFVLTDGDPSCEVKATEMTQLAVRGGIEVVYLLIGGDVRSDWLTNNAIPFAHAKTAGDLCPVLLDKVGELLA